MTGFAERGREIRGDRVPGRPESVLRLVLLVPLALVLAEGVNTLPHPVVPKPPAGLARLPEPILVLPTDSVSDQLYMLWSTDGFPTLVNGSGAYQPPRQRELLTAGSTFPSFESVEALRAAKVRTVVVLGEGPDPAQTDEPLDGVSMERRTGMTVYTLEP